MIYALFQPNSGWFESPQQKFSAVFKSVADIQFVVALNSSIFGAHPFSLLVETTCSMFDSQIQLSSP
jgi:hypothetical protein